MSYTSSFIEIPTFQSAPKTSATPIPRLRLRLAAAEAWKVLGTKLCVKRPSTETAAPGDGRGEACGGASLCLMVQVPPPT